jgi:pyrimidine 5'-nucleotidase
MCITTILFDLDDTLYPGDTGLWDELGERMNVYMRDYVHIPEGQIHDLRVKYYAEYGTTLKGLERFYGVKAEDYLAYVHDVDVTKFIHADPGLRDLLQTISLRKVIFTNADQGHAQRVTRALGVDDCFEQIVDVLRMEPYCKPFPQAYDKVMEILGDPEPCHYLLLDDAVRNIESALNAGMNAILVNPCDDRPERMRRINCIHDLPAVLDPTTGEYHV